MKCNQPFCDWVRNSQNLDHYVCLRCDRERYLNHSDAWWTFFIMFAIALMVALLLG
ncbi:MAG: hypothetical protein ACM37W_05240 [Actinomycetota bacterium]